MSRPLSAHAGGITMTEGSLYKNVFLFSVPLIFSQLLQVLFNMADVAVVGKFSSATALSKPPAANARKKSSRLSA